MPPKPKKLRTAGDVINRLRWPSNEDELTECTIVIGFWDGIEGWLEKDTKSWISASSDGDIPQHRILYFRKTDDNLSTEEQVIWDRRGRVDRVFHSGCGDGPISKETLNAVQQAKQNMIRLEQERLEKRKEKTRQRERRATRRKQLAVQGKSLETGGNRLQKGAQRFEWSATRGFVYSPEDDEWVEDEQLKIQGQVRQRVLSEQCPKYLLILDFEATCNNVGPRLNPQEIIEFPILVLEVATGRVVDKFHHYVLPDVHPTISEFCTELTGITQEMVERSGLNIHEVLKRHRLWLHESNLVPLGLYQESEREEAENTFLYLTCGDWDLNTCLPAQLAHCGRNTPPCFDTWINVKHAFRSFYGKKATGMTGMLAYLGMKLEGRHHSGIGDCHNIARICQRMLEEGWEPRAPSDSDENHESDWNRKEDIAVVTWNVLFDLFDEGIEGQQQQEEATPSHHRRDDQNLSDTRWRALCSMIGSSRADLISLQEVTPDFVMVLCQSRWIREDFVCSAAPNALHSVTPSGVLVLWRKSSMSCFSKDCSLFQCLDCNRSRSVVASLVSAKLQSVILFAAAHLPADKAGGTSEKESRKLARKRELSAILGQLERLQNHISSQARNLTVTPIIAGDFNCEDEELLDGIFAEKSTADGPSHLFRDVWSSCLGLDPGWTFDPKSNPRAARSITLVGGKGKCKRIDRVFVGPAYSKNVLQSSLRKELVPLKAELLGKSDLSLPPSDHYGVRVVLEQAAHNAPPTSVSLESAWAANAPPSLHYMVAVVLDNPKLEVLKMKEDQQSSLPLLHITLLHGFAEDYGCLDLVKSHVQEAMFSAGKDMSPPSELIFSRDSLGVFEYRASSTLVALPDKQSPGHHWLSCLYHDLRKRFVSCNDQEKHSASGWTPHVTLGVVGSSARASEMQASWIQNGGWDPDGESMSIRSVDILKRGENGKFHSICSLCNIANIKLPRTVDDLLADCGGSLFQRMEEQAAAAVSRVKRASRKAAWNMPVVSTVHVIGSCQLQAALPGFSDIDAVLELKPKERDPDSLAYLSLLESRDHFFKSVFDSLTEEIPNAKARFRPAGDGIIMTIRIPELPSVDLSLCVCDEEDRPLNDRSRDLLASIQDGEEIISALSNTRGEALVKAFQGALRLLKLWAFRHDVYGAASGFLGGSGWAVWLARSALDAVERGDLKIKNDNVQTSHELIRLFFCTDRTDTLRAITLYPREEAKVSHSLERHLRLGTLSILAPCSHGDLSQSTTQSSTIAIQTELQQTAVSLKRSQDLSCILQIRTTTDFIAKFTHVMTMELCCASISEDPHSMSVKPAELKAKGNQQFLNLLVTLEKRTGNASCLRPKAQPLKMGKEWNAGADNEFGFCWLVGLKCDDSSFCVALQSLIAQLQSDILRDVSAAFGATDSAEILHCNIKILTSTEAKGTVVKSKKVRSFLQ